MVIKNISRYFNGGDWKVLYREKGSKKFLELIGQPNYWYADPFLFEYKKKTFLLTEAFDKKMQIGKIAVSVEKNGIFNKPVNIIENIFHMSYPSIFENSGKVYVLPEAGESNRLELYEFSDFPNSKYKRYTLLKNVKYADCTVYVADNKIYIWAYDDAKNESMLYTLNLQEMKVNLHKSKVYEQKKYRPAGAFFEENGKVYRPTQNCSGSYGGSLILNELLDLDELKDRPIKEYRPADISSKYTKLHTYNRSSYFETVDVFLPEKGITCFVNNVKRKIHRIKLENLC